MKYLGINVTEPVNRPAACANTKSFPQGMDAYASITYHGSWNTEVVYMPMDKAGNGQDECPPMPGGKMAFIP